MRDWLRWVQLGIILALPVALWASSIDSTVVWLVCGMILFILIPISLGVSSFRNWQKWQQKMMTATGRALSSPDTSKNGSSPHD